MANTLAIAAFIGVLVQTGGNFVGAFIGAAVVWVFCTALWSPTKVNRYDGQGNRDSKGAYFDR